MDLMAKYLYLTSRDRLKDRERELGTTSSRSLERQPLDTASAVSDFPQKLSSTPQKSSINGVTYLPETPEDVLISSSKGKNGHRPRVDSLSDSEEPVVSSRKTKGKRIILTDSENESDDQSHNAKSKIAKMAQDGPPDLFADKELSLRTLMHTFPKMDLMKVQDTLVKCDWFAQKAIHVLQDTCDPLTCEHFPKPEPSPEEKPEPPNEENPEPPLEEKPEPPQEKEEEPECKLETSSTHVAFHKDQQQKLSELEQTKFEREAVCNFKLQPSVQTETNMHNNNLNNKETLEIREKLCVASKAKSNSRPTNSTQDLHQDIANTNHVNNTPDTKTPNCDLKTCVLKRKPARHRIHQLSSDSDDEDGVTIISMESMETAKAVNSSSKAVRKNQHEMSSDEKDTSEPASPQQKKKKRRKKDLAPASDDEVDFAKDDLYDSDDSDIDDQLTPAREAVLNFYRHASGSELLMIPGCSKKKVDTIIGFRPVAGWVDLVKKLQSHRNLSTDMLAGARDIIVTREVMSKLMQKCEKIASDMEKVATQMNSKSTKGNCIQVQPEILNQNFKLAPYQLIGLNWLWVMHSRRLNGILADEMGLGKTIQAISFLAYLKMVEGKKNSRHLVIVPSSTLDNWIREFQNWCPSMVIITYHGSQEMRRELRLQIINDEIEHFDIMMTTYNMLSSSPEDRTLFRRLEFHYVVFDEAHMLKNMNTQRYQNLMKIKAARRLLLTGTPLQNNLVELMSLIIFVMPDMFYGKIDQVKQMFASACKSEENRSDYERNRIEHAKRIMKPFVLRRLKKEVLKELPTKHEEVLHCYFTSYQNDIYSDLVTTFTQKISEDEKQDPSKQSGVVMMMELRKTANHPLLIRRKYTDEMLRQMSKELLNEPTYLDASSQFIFEDMQVMSDFELHKLCKNFKSISKYKLTDDDILDSGKFKSLDRMLPEMKEKGSRFLLFSQFTMMLDIVEEYMAIRKHTYLRLDGSTPVGERQELMDRYNGDPEIFAFLLSTKAGGLGINLTAANVVLLHDIDFNPYNDKQAEDRCHRLGQTREVTVKKMIMKGSIEETILQCAMDKLKLERDITCDNENDSEEDLKTVGNILKTALGL